MLFCSLKNNYFNLLDSAKFTTNFIDSQLVFKDLLIEISQIIAPSVKPHLLKAELNISQLTKAAGISKSMLSQIES